jgi:hypothetical protein
MSSTTLSLNFDTTYPIDSSLKECKYLYRCGKSQDEVERYFFVPDDFNLFYLEHFLDEETKNTFEKTKKSFTLTIQYDEDALPEYQDMEKPVIVQRKYYQITRSDIRNFNLKLFYATFYHSLTHQSVYDIDTYCKKFCRECIAPDMDSLEYYQLVIESQIFQPNGKTTNAEIRRNYETIHQFNGDELDKFDQFILDQFVLDNES